MARARRQTPSKRLILDAGAVIGLSRADVRARAALHAALEADADAADLRLLARDDPKVIIEPL